MLIDEPLPSEVVYSLHGEYDLANAFELDIALRRFCDETSGDVVIDCTGLRFWDSSAIAVLVQARARMRAGHRAVRLSNLHGVPLRALQALNLAESFLADASDTDAP